MALVLKFSSLAPEAEGCKLDDGAEPRRSDRTRTHFDRNGLDTGGLTARINAGSAYIEPVPRSGCEFSGTSSARPGTPVKGPRSFV